MNAFWLIFFFLDKSTKFNIIFIYFSARLGCICCDDFTFFGNSVLVMVVEQSQIRKYRQSPQKGRLNKLPSFVLYMNQSMNVSRVIQSWNERKKYEKPKRNWFCLNIRTSINLNTNWVPFSYLTYDVKTLCVSILR